jgi:hypothetical protein
VKKLLILSFALVILFGCSKGPEIKVTQASSQLPAGWQPAVSDDGKVEVGVPSGWRQGVDTIASGGDLAPAGMGMAGEMPAPQATGDASLDKSLSEMSAEANKTSKEMEQKQLAKLKEKGIVINVINGSKPIPGEARTHYYVKIKKMGGNITPEEAKEETQKTFLHKVTPTEVKTPIGTAYRFEETRQLVDGANYTEINYAIINGSDLYVLAFVTEEQSTAITQIDKDVIQTLRIKA